MKKINFRLFLILFAIISCYLNSLPTQSSVPKTVVLMVYDKNTLEEQEFCIQALASQQIRQMLHQLTQSTTLISTVERRAIAAPRRPLPSEAGPAAGASAAADSNDVPSHKDLSPQAEFEPKDVEVIPVPWESKTTIQAVIGRFGSFFGATPTSARENAGKILGEMIAKEKQQGNTVIVISYANSTNVAVHATLQTGAYIDILMTINPYVYDDDSDYTPNEQNIGAIYNLYSKAFTSRQPRKYKQLNRFPAKVKNIRLVKEVDGKLDNITNEEMLSEKVLLKIPSLIRATQPYQLNFDFIAKIFDSRPQEVGTTAAAAGAATASAPLQAAPSDVLLVINRFVALTPENHLRFNDGSREYNLLGSQLLPTNSLPNIRTLFTRELSESIRNYNALLAAPTTQSHIDYYSEFVTRPFGGTLAEDLSRIRTDHITASSSSPLYQHPQADVLHQNQIARFLQRYNQGQLLISHDYAFHQIQRGGEIAYYLTYADKQEFQEYVQQLNSKFGQKKYLEEIIALMWYLFAQAITKNQGFDEGAFIIRGDRTTVDRFFAFLHRYIHKFGTLEADGALPIEAAAGTLSRNPFGYPRKSSHLTHEKREFDWGIDIRFGETGQALPLLPAYKRHILFTLIENGTALYIKPENYGIYLRDFAHHAFEYAQSLVVKQAAAASASSAASADDAPNYRKERIPKATISQFIRLFNIQPDQESTRQAQTLGIQFMIQVTKERLQRDPSPELYDLYAQLHQEYDLVNYRYGREVIITPQELLSSLYYANKDKQQVQEILTHLATLQPQPQQQQTKTDYEENLRRAARMLQVPPETVEELVNAYIVLGVTPETSFEDIRKQFKRLALQFHPDRHSTAQKTVQEENAEKLKLINAAHEFFTEQRETLTRLHTDTNLLDIIIALVEFQKHKQKGFSAFATRVKEIQAFFNRIFDTQQLPMIRPVLEQIEQQMILALYFNASNRETAYGIIQEIYNPQSDSTADRNSRYQQMHRFITEETIIERRDAAGAAAAAE